MSKSSRKRQPRISDKNLLKNGRIVYVYSQNDPELKEDRNNKKEKFNIGKIIFSILSTILISLGLVSFTLNRIALHHDLIIKNFKDVKQGITDVVGDQEKLYSACVSRESEARLSDLQTSLGKDVTKLVSAHRNLGLLVSRKDYLQIHEFTYCYMSSITSEPIKNVCALVRKVQPDKMDKWKNNLLPSIEYDQAEYDNTWPIVLNYFNNKAKLRHSMPTESYGFCKRQSEK
jgi:hypothetical protein